MIAAAEKTGNAAHGVVPERRMNTAGNRRENGRCERLSRVNDPIRLPCANAYVRSMTMTAREGKSRPCQGLHKTLILPYGSSHTVR
jgi:hypothetical protein